jgi:hypothetical protein
MDCPLGAARIVEGVLGRMRSVLPTPEDDRRIIPFPRVLTRELPAPHLAEVSEELLPTRQPSSKAPTSEASARHYLKFMLPSIPITMFVLGFVYCSLLVGTHGNATPSTQATNEIHPESALPLLGALLLALASGTLCVMIYFGYLRACGERMSSEP